MTTSRPSAKLTDPAIMDVVRSVVLVHGALDGSRVFVLGICGSQGSGKSTLSAILQDDLTSRGLPTAVLSIDDIYKTKAERSAMAQSLHPLFATRGVPGTHEVSLALDALSALESGNAVPLPRFDKAADDRAHPGAWGMAPAGTRVLILEGWFVGCRPAQDADPAPLNALEATQDPDGKWRRLVEQALHDEYQALFARIDALVLLAAPDLEEVLGWRTQQEHQLRDGGRGGMSDDEVIIFIQHYERLTRRILAEMPGYADLVINLDQQRRARSILRRGGVAS